MIETFKETWRSLQDLKFGTVIIGKTFGQALWYWTKYYILILGIFAGLGLAALVYFTPQLGSILSERLPDYQFSIMDGRVQTDLPQPFIEGDEEFVVIINTQGTIDDLQDFKAGLMLLEDKLVAKTDTEIRIIDLSEFDDVTADKATTIEWVNDNQGTLLGVGIVALVVLTVVLGGIVWMGRLIAFLVWGVFIWVVAKVLGKVLTYTDTVKLVIYASVLPLLLNIITSVAPNSILTWLTLVVFLFYSLVWVYNLPGTKKR